MERGNVSRGARQRESSCHPPCRADTVSCAEKVGYEIQAVTEKYVSVVARRLGEKGVFCVDKLVFGWKEDDENGLGVVKYEN